MPFVADFETTTTPEDCRVWAWGMVMIGHEDFFQWGIDIESFIAHCEKMDGEKIYFHNIKFDAEFLLHYFLSNNFKHTTRKTLNNLELQTLISDMGQFYSMRVKFANGSIVTFWDSLKLIPLKVAQIPKAFDIADLKGDIDYNKYRPVGYIPDDNELSYLKNDVVIVSKALNIMFSQGLTKLTQAGCALKEFKSKFSKKEYERLFPQLNNDAYIRKSYKGGYVFLNPIYASVDLEKVNIFDVNSLYPSVMYNKPMPIGRPVYYKGEYKEDKFFPLFVQRFRCCFELKKDKLPTLQIKNNLRFCSTEYLYSSENEIVELTLTSVDLKLFLEHYDTYELAFIDGYMFQQSTNLFKTYIDHWNAVKIEATKSGNAGLRQIAKLMLNSLYGRFAISPIVKSKIPYLSEENIIKYRLTPDEKREGLYLPIGTFITSYAREQTIRTAQTIKEYSIEKYGVDMYIYSDTDSIHTTLPKEDCEKIIDVDNTRLGAWKHEGVALKARFIRAKTYIEYIKEVVNEGFSKLTKKVTCAGLPENCYPQVNWNNFREGLELWGKLAPKRTVGGVTLQETTFSIK